MHNLWLPADSLWGWGDGVQKSLTRKIPKLSWKLSFGSSSEVPADFSSGSVSYFFSSSILGSKTTISSESISMTLHIPVRGWTFFTGSHWFLLQSPMNILLWYSMASSFCLQSPGQNLGCSVHIAMWIFWLNWFYSFTRQRDVILRNNSTIHETTVQVWHY